MNFATITDYLDYIFEEFQDEIAEMDSLCDLRNVSFANGNLPDYNNRAQALLYCLRYHFAYAFEYEYIYCKHILKHFSNRQINVLSVGCGNGIDFWSLDQAINRSGSSIRRINYLGVDRADWGELFDGTSNDAINYYYGNVQELPACMDNVDVVIFPKSLCELNSTDLKHIADLIDQSSNELYIVASFRAEPNNMIDDVSVFDGFIELLLEKGFSISEGKLAFIHTVTEDNAIVSVYNDYIYPDDALTFIDSLYDNCPENAVAEYGCQRQCNSTNRRAPILNTCYSKYNVVKVSR